MRAMTTLLMILGSVCSGLCALAFVAPFAYLAFVSQRRADEAYRGHIKKWAGENDWEIVKCQRRWFGSPWMFSPSGSHGIYHVTVVYQEGHARQRRVWVRCGGWFLGPKTERVEMRWDGVSQPFLHPQPAPQPARSQDDPMWDRVLDG
jgi:hypothetical protein